MLFKPNVGPMDRIARLVLGAVLIALPYVYTSPVWDNVFLRWGVPVVGLIVFMTGLLNSCLIYRIIDTSTLRKD